jgi:hypothetical protein
MWVRQPFSFWFFDFKSENCIFAILFFVYAQAMFVEWNRSAILLIHVLLLFFQNTAKEFALLQILLEEDNWPSL